jgi:aerobic carbon-monoxide dehydrogenase large subunit
MVLSGPKRRCRRDPVAAHTDYGIKGVGEGGAIPPPAAIFNAVNDALRGLGVEFNETPLTPPKLVLALAEAEARKGGPGTDA